MFLDTLTKLGLTIKELMMLRMQFHFPPRLVQLFLFSNLDMQVFICHWATPDQNISVQARTIIYL